jgi:hypothetical protein
VKWKKSSPELVETFQAVVPGPPATVRPMFGFPAAFVHGNMFMGLHQDDLIVRLPEGQRRELLALTGARVFEPMPGRPMSEYVVVPRAMHSDRAALRAWAARALAFGTSLPPKAGRTPAKQPTAVAKKRSR